MGQARVNVPGVSPMMQPSVPSIEQQNLLMNDAIEKARRAAELQKKIAEQLASKPNLVSVITPSLNIWPFLKLRGELVQAPRFIQRWSCNNTIRTSGQ